MQIAAWLDRRLDATLGFHLPAARLYGIVVNDPLGLADDRPDAAAAARSSFIGEGRDAYALLGGSFGVLARSFDAAAIVTGGWAAPMLADGTMTHRPSRHPDRRRVRAVAVVSDAGVASVLRFEDDPTEQILRSEPGIGDMVDSLEAMWFGNPADLVNLRTTRGGCTRHP
ncbi:MAG: hypothetical protein JWN62_1722 [Acidimicrobiales bacterium]|nr:hypothetical protein [Acidimicrobiales bacterium]